MKGDKKQQNIKISQNEDNSNLKFTITYFTLSKTIQPNPQNSVNSRQHKIYTANRTNNTSYKSRNQMNKIYSKRNNVLQDAKEDKNHIMFANQKDNTETKNNMFLTWRERHNKLVSANHRDGIMHDIIRKIKSTQIKSQNRLPFLTNEEQPSNPLRQKIKNRWQNSKEVNTPIELISRKLQCDRNKSQRMPKKLFQIKNMQKPIFLNKFMGINNQKSHILRISGWEANYGGFQDQNI